MCLKKNSVRSFVFVSLFLLILAFRVSAQEKNKPDAIDTISLKKLLDYATVDIASFFEEDMLVAGSTVSSITSDDFRKRGARRMHEALDNELSVMPLLTNGSFVAIPIRGYTQLTSTRGIATVLDGVPLNSFLYGTALYGIPNWELGTLNKIEMIKGPGSAIYGSDAFHGVLSWKTFESDEDYYSVETAGAYPLYGEANMKVSRGFADDVIRLDMALGTSGQGDLELDYEYGSDGQTLASSRSYKYKSMSGVAKLTVNPTEKLKMKLGAYTDHLGSNGFPGYGLTVGASDIMDNDTQFYMGNGSVICTLENDISVEASGYYWDGSWDLEPHVTRGRLRYYSARNIRYGSDIIVKQPDNDLNLQWIIGYSHTSFEVKKYTIMRSEDHILRTEGSQGKDRTINSFLGQIKWGLMEDRLYVLLGSRLDHYDDFGNQYTPRAGLIFLPSENSSVKALYGRGFRAPVAGEYSGAHTTKGNSDLEPEYIDVYELICMYDTKNWRVGVNGFYSLWKNGIGLKAYDDPEEFFRYTYGNVLENRAYGGEISINYSYDPFKVEIGYSYVLSEALDIKDPDDPAGTSDRRYGAFPKHSIIAGLYYFLKPYDISFYLSNRLYFDMKENPAERHPTGKPEDLPVYWRTDLGVSRLMTDKTEFRLNIRNLQNRRNYVPSLWGAEGGVEEPGISVSLGVRHTF